ncbi:unnamed protein product [Rotaria sordida]|uniref:Uncharacterized protein n=1 Tax=Rotaria sordida TaxID=392033 RepID=A0A818NQ24_9BILA|nr:unnamed protein product [Rotaria sordida]CAF3608367.1 unnamed protein product [Rotaria sordida]
MERILLAVDYRNLTELKLFNFKQEVALSYFTNESSLRHIFQQQITDLILINNDKEKMIGSLSNYTINVYGHILKFFKNLTHLNITEGFNSSYPGLILRDLPSTTFFSSILTHLCINTYNLDDCLYLLDGRLKQLTTLIVRIHYMHFSSTVHNMDNLLNLKCLSLKCYAQTRQYDEAILPLLRRMSYLENLTLYLRIKNRGTFIDRTHLENEIHVYMPQLHSFTFYICTYDYTADLFRYVPSQDIQRNVTYDGHQRMASIINYINSCLCCTAVCTIFSLPFAFDRLEHIGNIFPDIVFKKFGRYISSIEKSNENLSNIRLINELLKSSSSATFIDNMRLKMANFDTLPRSETASYTSMNSTQSSVTKNGGGGSGSTNFDIDFNESNLQVHKRSPFYIIQDSSSTHRTGRLEEFQNYCFLPLDLHDVSQIKASLNGQSSQSLSGKY